MLKPILRLLVFQTYQNLKQLMEHLKMKINKSKLAEELGVDIVGRLTNT